MIPVCIQILDQSNTEMVETNPIFKSSSFLIAFEQFISNFGKAGSRFEIRRRSE